MSWKDLLEQLMPSYKFHSMINALDDDFVCDLVIAIASAAGVEKPEEKDADQMAEELLQDEPVLRIMRPDGIAVREDQIDSEYAKVMVKAMLDRIISDNVFSEDALDQLRRVEGYVEKAKARAALLPRKIIPDDDKSPVA